MKILVLEYVTGGGLRQETIPASLAQEGGLMRNALAEDLLGIADVELILFHDDRLAIPVLGSQVQVVNIAADQPFPAIWQHWIKRCDAAWPVAPETGGILERLCLDVEAAGKALLTCHSAAVRLAASKLETIKRLERFGLPTVPTLFLDPFLSTWQPSALPFVIKPDDGVGCEGARIINDSAHLPVATANWIAQPLLFGESLSLSALFAQGQARLLSCNRQIIEQTGDGFTLQACQVNAIPDQDGRWQALAGQVALALPELWGYAGIDFMLTEGGPVILEINPRLTTSYAGLRRATGENAAALTLELLKTGVLPPPRRQPGVPVAINLEN